MSVPVGGNYVPLVRGSSFRIYTTIPFWLPPRFFFPWPYQVRMFHLRFSSREGGTGAGGYARLGTGCVANMLASLTSALTRILKGLLCNGGCRRSSHVKKGMGVVGRSFVRSPAIRTTNLSYRTTCT